MKESAKLLFVEDDQDFAEATSTLLRRSGFSVRVCGDLTEARQALSQERFDLMLADWNLPDGSSPELIVSLAEAQQSCAAIVLTAHNDAPMILEAMRAGAVDFLTKPIRHAELVAAIGRVLGHSPNPQAPKVRTSLAQAKQGGITSLLFYLWESPFWINMAELRTPTPRSQQF